MKKKITFFFLVGLFSLSLEAKGKKNQKERLSRGQSGYSSSVGSQQVATGSISGVPTPVMNQQVAMPPASQADQQFFQNEFFAIQNSEIAILKAKIAAAKAKSAENRKIIDRGIGEIVMNKIIRYKK
jgi:hypothetical protein